MAGPCPARRGQRPALRTGASLATSRAACETSRVKPEDLREFARRSRAPVARAKRQYWQQAAMQGDGLAAFEVAQELYEHARAVSDFPSAAYAAADFEHQVRLKQLIDRAAQAASSHRAAR